jgi:hypothetical protein
MRFLARRRTRLLWLPKLSRIAICRARVSEYLLDLGEEGSAVDRPVHDARRMIGVRVRRGHVAEPCWPSARSRR